MLIIQIIKLIINRRKEIRELSSTLEGDELLMIDGLLSEAGSDIAELWEKEGGNKHYPPSSLQSLLSMYLLPGIPTATKHRIVQYLFLDLASLLSDG